MPRRRGRVRGLHVADHHAALAPGHATPSRSAPPTPPATRARPPRARSSIDTTAPTATINSGPPARPTTRRRRSRSPPRPTRRSSAASTARSSRRATRRSPTPTLARRQPHLPGPRDRRRRQHRHGRLARPSRSTRPRPTTTITSGPDRRDQRHDADVGVRVQQDALDVRVPDRRRELRALHHAVHPARPLSRPATTRSRSGRSTRPATPTPPRLAHDLRRHDRARTRRRSRHPRQNARIASSSVTLHRHRRPGRHGGAARGRDGARERRRRRRCLVDRALRRRRRAHLHRPLDRPGRQRQHRRRRTDDHGRHRRAGHDDLRHRRRRSPRPPRSTR